MPCRAGSFNAPDRIAIKGNGRQCSLPNKSALHKTGDALARVPL